MNEKVASKHIRRLFMATFDNQRKLYFHLHDLIQLLKELLRCKQEE